MIVVSDTSPLCYLLLIDLIDLLPQLYGRVIIPQAVFNELATPKSPAPVREWIAQPPDWLEVQVIINQSDSGLEELDLGEREAISLAEELQAELILLDDKLARQVASARGLELIGVLGILVKASQQGMVDFPIAVKQLQQTTFRASASLIQALMEQFS